MTSKKVDYIQKIRHVGAWIGSKRLPGEIFVYSAIEEETLNKAYDILINNPKITVEEYIEQMDLMPKILEEMERVKTENTEETMWSEDEMEEAD